MNEIITKLDEIEKKAESILTDAAAQKETMLKQLEFDKREMDERYASMEEREEEEERNRIFQSADRQSDKQRVRHEEEMEQFLNDFDKQRDALAEEIFERIIQI